MAVGALAPPRRRSRQRGVASSRVRLLLSLAAVRQLAARAAIPLAVPLLYVLAIARHNAFVIGVTNLDYFPQIDWALRLQWDAWQHWVYWKWPVGLAWLIRLALGLGIDSERFGQALATVGGTL